MAKSIIIIGAGMGGMAAGIYGQINGYETQIFELHAKAGGQCASWKRKGYTFDACIHHFFGCRPGSRTYALWHEVGAMPRELVNIEECTAVASPDGKMFIDYYDVNRKRYLSCLQQTQRLSNNISGLSGHSLMTKSVMP
jgi:phytoene dehydrogenase-like protein